MAPTVTRLCIVLLALATSACGFSLRGSDSITTRFTNLQLLSAQPGSEMTRLLQRSLQNAGVDVELVAVMPEEAASDAILGLGEEGLTRRPVTVNPRARAAQYEIRLSVDIALQEVGNEVIPLETLSVERTYFEDIENIAGSQEEVEIITAELRRELVNQILRRLQAPAVNS